MTQMQQHYWYECGLYLSLRDDGHVLRRTLIAVGMLGKEFARWQVITARTLVVALAAGWVNDVAKCIDVWCEAVVSSTVWALEP